MIEQRRTVYHMRDREIRLMPLAREHMKPRAGTLGALVFLSATICFAVLS